MFLSLLISALVVAVCSRILYVAGTIMWVQRQPKTPATFKAIVVLGGAAEREREGALLACTEAYRTARLIVSSGCFRRLEDFDPHDPTANAPHLFEGIDFCSLKPRLKLDRRACDTVTNFTSLAADLKHAGSDRVKLVTSDYHVPRARAIARVAWHYHGIQFDIHAVHGTTETMIRPGDTQLGELSAAQRKLMAASESRMRIARDVIRAWFWVLFGVSGAGISCCVHPERD